MEKTVKKTLLKEYKQKLEEEKTSIEEELETFAKKDKKLEGDWDTKYPKLNGGTGGQSLEEAADAVEEYSNRLPVEFSLELRLRDINSALEKIKKGKYGVCEKCGKPIPQARLKVFPEARTCKKCKA